MSLKFLHQHSRKARVKKTELFQSMIYKFKNSHYLLTMVKLGRPNRLS